MGELHLTRIAFGCSGIDVLEERIAARSIDGLVSLTTRYRPKRADELIGGSLYWIIKHQIVARMEIAAFVEDESIKKWNIVVKEPLVAVQSYPRRAHQGWRYLAAGDAPPDSLAGEKGEGSLPAGLTSELANLGLV
ncbi:MAG: DUF1489 family protein [Sphingomonadaceae bacterium]